MDSIRFENSKIEILKVLQAIRCQHHAFGFLSRRLLIAGDVLFKRPPRLPAETDMAGEKTLAGLAEENQGLEALLRLFWT